MKIIPWRFFSPVHGAFREAVVGPPFTAGKARSLPS